MTVQEEARFGRLLQGLLQLGRECEWVEFKHNFANPDGIGEYVSALSNSAAIENQEQGYLVWGIEDDTLNVVGTTYDPYQTHNNQVFENWLSTLSRPRLGLRFYVFTLEGHRIVILEIDRAYRLHSQFTRKAIESLRFATGDETLRRDLYSEFGQRLSSEFTSIRAALELRLKGDEPEGDGDGEEEEEAPKKKQAVSEKRRKKLLDAETWKRDQRLHETAKQLLEAIGETLFEDHNEFRQRVDKTLKTLGIKLSQTEKKVILKAVSWREETAARVISKIHKNATADPMHGMFEAVIDGKTCVVEFEPDTDLRDTENVSLLEKGGIEAFINREVLPHVPDAWVDYTKTQIGYEISFTRYFYKPKPMRTLEEIRRDIEALEKETDGLLEEVLVEVE